MKTTTFILAILLIVWMIIHPERASWLHVFAAIMFVAVGLTLLEPKKPAKRIKPRKRLRWSVDYWGIKLDYVPMKFYQEKVAHAYFKLIGESLYEKQGITRMNPLTPDRANNPIVVSPKRPMKLWKQYRYLDKKKDGRERIFRAGEKNCTSLLAKRGVKSIRFIGANTL